MTRHPFFDALGKLAMADLANEILNDDDHTASRVPADVAERHIAELKRQITRTIGQPHYKRGDVLTPIETPVYKQLAHGRPVLVMNRLDEPKDSSIGKEDIRIMFPLKVDETAQQPVHWGVLEVCSDWFMPYETVGALKAAEPGVDEPKQDEKPAADDQGEDDGANQQPGNPSPRPYTPHRDERPAAVAIP